MGFGKSGPQLAVPVDRKVVFKGYIDQINIDDNTIEGIQYRIGPTPEIHDNGHVSGRALSLPVELLALYELFPNLEIKRICHRYFKHDGSWQDLPFGSDNWPAKRRTLEKIVQHINQCVEDGLFFSVPSSQKCRCCPYTEACGPLRHSTYNSKRGDSRMLFFDKIEESKKASG